MQSSQHLTPTQRPAPKIDCSPMNALASCTLSPSLPCRRVCKRSTPLSCTKRARLLSDVKGVKACAHVSAGRNGTQTNRGAHRAFQEFSRGSKNKCRVGSITWPCVFFVEAAGIARGSRTTSTTGSIDTFIYYMRAFGVPCKRRTFLCLSWRQRFTRRTSISWRTP